MKTSHSRFRQVLGEQLVESLHTPLPPQTTRRVHGRVRFPGKATAVIGMRRAGKTTFLHQVRREAAARSGSVALTPYLSFEDERLIGLTADHLGLVLDEHARLLSAQECRCDGVVVLRRDPARNGMGAIRAAASRRAASGGVRLGVFGGLAVARDRIVAAGACVDGTHPPVLVRGILSPPADPASRARSHPVAPGTPAPGTRVHGLASRRGHSPKRKVWTRRRAIGCCATTSMSQSCETWLTVTG